ncbi:MAG TPA: hypothetical protein VND94_14400 [Terriglobia bacterium]|nr:hypothetical protein [Terriglobia bacterium]
MKVLYLAAMTLVFGLIGGVDAVWAGQCTTLIDNFQKQLSRSDAGMGPTSGTEGSANQQGSAGSGSNNGTPVTTGTSNALQGTAASPDDVAKQNSGEQTAAEAAKAGKSAPANVQSAQESLAQARELDKAGKEAECQAEVTKAKAAFGVE